jgi:hypothetical protein
MEYGGRFSLGGNVKVEQQFTWRTPDRQDGLIWRKMNRRGDRANWEIRGSVAKSVLVASEKAFIRRFPAEQALRAVGNRQMLNFDRGCGNRVSMRWTGDNNVPMSEWRLLL